MSQTPEKTVKIQGNPTTQRIFKYLSYSVLALVIYSFPGLYDFRLLCITKGLYVFSSESFVWSLIGFFGIFITKYAYYYLMEEKTEKAIKDKYQGEQRTYKVKSVLKGGLDCIFYTSISFWAIYMFWDDYWMPSQIGANGQCSLIYKQYPNWPEKNRINLQRYFMVQLGVHSFSLFQSIFIKRKFDRKFYEFLLHHILAATLIFFSVACNEITTCAIVLILHDISDIPMSLGKAYIETKYQRMIGTITFFFLTAFSWIYLRVIVFPFCVISQMFNKIPRPEDDWYVISLQYKIVILLSYVLIGMHLFWIYFMMKLGIRAARGERLVNPHEEASKNK